MRVDINIKHFSPIEVKEILRTMDNSTEVNLIVAEFPEIDYVLVRRNTNFQSWVAAWGYNEEKQCWSQGHYFCTIEEAMRYILDLQIAKKLNVA